MLLSSIHDTSTKICSITLASDSREADIGDAIRSVVGFVDYVLVVHLISTKGDYPIPDRTLEIAREIAGSKYRQVDITTDDFSADKIRDQALVHATELGADWGIICDADDRIMLNGFDLRHLLAKKEVGLYFVENATGAYNKPLAFRLPTTARYHGGIHEDCIFGGKWGVLPTVRFVEGPKYENGKIVPRRVNDEMFEEMQGQVAAEPDNPHWRYYLGEMLEERGRWAEAIRQHEATMGLSAENSAYAWACFHLSLCHYQLGNYHPAKEKAVQGMVYSPEFPELPWAAGVASLKLGAAMDAMAWANIAMVHQGGHIARRVGLKSPHAYFEAPYKLMVDAMILLGSPAQQIEVVKRKAEGLEEARIRYSQDGVMM